jgi:hypothetical protein
MTDEKWEALVGQVRRKFTISEHTTSEPDLRDKAVREVLVFEGPTGPMKLERVTRPLVLEKKPIYSGRAGAGVTYDYVLDPVERTHRESLFRWENNGWTEMDLSSISR